MQKVDKIKNAPNFIFVVLAKLDSVTIKTKLSSTMPINAILFQIFVNRFTYIFMNFAVIFILKLLCRTNPINLSFRKYIDITDYKSYEL